MTLLLNSTSFFTSRNILSAVQTQISPATTGDIIIKCLEERSWTPWLFNLMTSPSAEAQREVIKMINLLYVVLLRVSNRHRDTELRLHAAVRDNESWRDCRQAADNDDLIKIISQLQGLLSLKQKYLEFISFLGVLSIVGHLIHDDNKSCSGQTPTLEGRWIIWAPLSPAQASGTRWVW